MSTVTPQPVRLDTVIIQFNYINERLADIEDKIILDDWFKVLVIAMPVLIGILTFFLTRNKEITFKRAELAGEISMRLHELRDLRREYFYAYLDKCAFNAARRLNNYAAYSDSMILKQLGIENLLLTDHIQEKCDVLVKELVKYLGQYKFLLPKAKRKKVTGYSIALHINHIKYEFFDGCNTIDEIDDTREKIQWNTILEDSAQKRIAELLDRIEEITSES